MSLRAALSGVTNRIMDEKVLNSTIVVGIYTDYDTLYNFCKNIINSNEKKKHNLLADLDSEDLSTEEIINTYMENDHNTFNDLIDELLNDFENENDLKDVIIRSDHIKYCVCVLSSTDQVPELDLKCILKYINNEDKMKNFYEICKLITGKEVSKKDVKIIALSV